MKSTRLLLYIFAVLMTAVGGILLVHKGFRYESPSTNIIIVSPDGRGQYKTISEALLHARAGVTISVKPGVYRESLTITAPVEIVGLKHEDGYFRRLTSWLFTISNPYERDVIIQATDYSAVRMETTHAVIRNVSLRSRRNPLANNSGSGAYKIPAVDIPTGRLVLEDCEVTSDTGYGIAVYGADARPEIRRSKIHGALDAGIYAFRGSKPLIEECEIFDNKGPGIMVTEESAPSILSCDVHGNLYDLYMCGGADTLVKNSKFHDGEKAGIFADELSKGTIEDSEIYGHRQEQEVIVMRRSNLTLRRTKIYNGQKEGIWFYNNAGGLMEDCELYGNGNSGIIISDRSNPTIRRTRLYGMTHGGILFMRQGSGVIEDCEITDHVCMGILIVSGSDPVIRNTRIHRNNEGAIVVRENGKGTVENCDLRDNRDGGLIVSPDSEVKNIGNTQ